MNAGDVNVPKPASGLEPERENVWYPYGLQDKENSSGLKNPTELICRQFVVLWEMISPVGHILYVLIALCYIVKQLIERTLLTIFRYGCSDISRHDLQRLCFQVTEDLFAWKANLPSNLEINLDDDTTPILPHLLILQ